MEIVSLLKNNGKVARVQLDDGSIIDNVVILYPYGLFANIKIDDNSLGLLFCQNTRDYCYVIPYNIAKQPTLTSGSVAIGDFENDKIIKIVNGNVVINTNVIIEGSLSANGAVNLGNNLVIAGTLTTVGTVNLQGTTTIQGKVFTTHTHSGVQSGSSITGGVV